MTDAAVQTDWTPAPAPLIAYLRGRLPGARTDIWLKPISGGRSHLTYWLRTESGLFVLRQAPRASDLPTAHDLEREFSMLTTLADHGIRVAAPLMMCSDRGVMGAPFMVMSAVDGFALSTEDDGALLSLEERHDVSRCFIEQLAAIHAVDRPAGTGPTRSFLDRQVDRWTSQWHAGEGLHPPELNRRFYSLADAVRAAGVPQLRVSLVHGDYRLDNVLLRRVAGSIEVAAVIDWEMATFGDPLVDLGYTLAAWTQEDDSADRSDLPVGARVSAHRGFLTRRQLVRHYADLCGPVPDTDVYEAFGFLKLAAIFAGINRLGFRQSARVDRRLTRHVDRLVTNGHRLLWRVDD